MNPFCENIDYDFVKKYKKLYQCFHFFLLFIIYFNKNRNLRRILKLKI